MGEAVKASSDDPISFDDILSAGAMARDFIVLLLKLVDVFEVPITIVDSEGGELMLNELATKAIKGPFKLGDSVADWEPLYWRDEACTIPLPVEDLPLARTLRDGVTIRDYSMWVRWSQDLPPDHLTVSTFPAIRRDGSVAFAIATWPLG